MIANQNTGAWGNDPLNPGAPPSGSDTGVTGNGAGVRQWALGAFAPGNYPACVQFHEDRLCFAGCAQTPARIDMSNSGEYEVFSPSALLDGTVNAANACSFSLNSNTVNAIRWIQSDQHGMLCGTAGGEWIVSSANGTDPIGPTSISAKQTTTFGCVNVPPVHITRETLFLQLGGRKLRNLKYSFMIDAYEGGDLSLLADHLTRGGFTCIAVQRTPQQVLWLVRSDGELVSVTYDADQNELAWCPHPLGGHSDAAGNLPPVVLSAACIPSPDGTRDEVWLAVRRWVNGAACTYIERMGKLWEVGDAVTDATVTPPAQRYVPSVTPYLDSCQRLNVADAVTEVSGLDWLEGETVAVLADGAAHPDCKVESGRIELVRPTRDAVIGYPYLSRVATLPIEAGGADGPAQGKLKRVHNVVFQVYESAGFQVLGDSGHVDEVPTRTTTDYMGDPPPLHTGSIRAIWDGTYDRDAQVTFEQDQPLPLNVYGLSVQLETQDGG